jgi:hypothetical protein
MSASAAESGGDGIAAQASEFSGTFGTDLYSKVSNPVPGTVNMKSVLPGFVYRGGSSTQNNVALSDSQLLNLCKAGFSAAVYAYPTVGGFHEHEVSCGSNRIHYYGFSGESSGGRGNTMSLIAKTINEGRGPVYVHCWNGLHSSGNIAGTTLMSFCGMSASQAASYWGRNAGGPRAAAGSHFSGETHQTGLELSSEARAALCGHSE